MAKSFSNIKKYLDLLDFIPVGKYKNCRVDSIIEQDSDYLIFMDKEGILKFSPSVIDALKVKFSADSIQVTQPKDSYDSYYLTDEDDTDLDYDIPF